jgi:hypothetical protein
MLSLELLKREACTVRVRRRCLNGLEGGRRWLNWLWRSGGLMLQSAEVVIESYLFRL